MPPTKQISFNYKIIHRHRHNLISGQILGLYLIRPCAASDRSDTSGKVPRIFWLIHLKPQCNHPNRQRLLAWFSLTFRLGVWKEEGGGADPPGMQVVLMGLSHTRPGAHLTLKWGLCAHLLTCTTPDTRMDFNNLCTFSLYTYIYTFHFQGIDLSYWIHLSPVGFFCSLPFHSINHNGDLSFEPYPLRFAH